MKYKRIDPTGPRAGGAAVPGGVLVLNSTSIPKINQTIPIYHGTDDSAYCRWAPDTCLAMALPVGGEKHSIGCAGSPPWSASARLFSDIDQLEEGDMIYLHILGGEVHAYRVENIPPMVPKDISRP